MRVACSAGILLFLSVWMQARHLDYNATCRDIYRKILHLDVEAASAQIEDAIAADADNAMYAYLGDYLNVLPVILNEDEEAYTHGRRARDDLIRLLKRTDKESPWRNFALGEVYLRWAIADYKMGREWRSAWGIVRAYKYLSRNDKVHPEFRWQDKSLGLIEALMGSLPIPKALEWVMGQMTGIDASVRKGYARIEDLNRWMIVSGNNVFREEVIVTLAYLRLHLFEDRDGAWDIVQRLELTGAESPLAAFVKANIAMRSGRNDQAIEVLENRGYGRGISFPYLDLMLGEARLFRLDRDANMAIERFLAHYRGASYRKRAYQRLYHHALVFNTADTSKWKLAMLNEGKQWTDADRQVALEASSGKYRSVTLIKAGLLYDGAYYDRANDVLTELPVSARNLEYFYRLARVCHARGKFEEAISWYKEVIDIGAKSPQYFACNAALQLGLIHEEASRYHLAEKAFEQCLSLVPAGYRRSLHMKARAGLSRLKQLSEQQ